MKKIEVDSIFIVLLYINIIYASSLLAACFLIDGFNYLYVSGLVMVSAGVFLLWKHILISKKKKVLVSFAAICAAIAYCCFRINNTMVWIDKINVEYSDISSKINDSTITYFSQYKLIIAVLLPLIVLILLVIISKGFYDITIFSLSTLVIVLWYAGFNDIIKERLFGFVIVNGVIFAMNSYIRTVKSLNKKRINLDLKTAEFFIYSLVSSFIIATVIIVFPVTAPGKYSGTIKHRIKNELAAKEAASNKTSGLEYGLSLSGYSDSSKKLGGTINIDDSVAFTVKAEKPVYLRGTARDYYDGMSWTKKNEKLSKKEKSSLLTNSGAYTFILYQDLREISIHPENLITSTVFMPQYAFNIDIDNNDLYYDRDNTFQAKKNIEHSYKIQYHPYMRNFGVISNSQDGMEYKNMDSEYKFSIKEKPDIMSKYDGYLQIPDNMPRRVYDLVNEITKGCNTRGEKVEKIYNYLKNSYSYSINVSEVSSNEDFVDYFLFGEKKGYCTYFASACTIMCRMAGVPAKYVEGFNMTDRMNDKGMYVVTNRNAHAWTEILIGPETNLWSIVDCVPNAEELLTKEINENKSKIEEDSAFQDLPLKDKKRRDKNDPADNLQNTGNRVKLSFGVIALIFLGGAGIAYLLWTLLIHVYRMSRIVKNKSIIPLYMFYIKNMKLIGYKRPQNSCDMEFALTVEDKELKGRLVEIVDAAYAERFGGKTTSNIDKKEYYRFIRRYVKKQKRRLI